MMDEVTPYALNAFDCPGCGEQNLTDVDLGSVEECNACGTKLAIL